MTYPATLSQMYLLAAQPEPFATMHTSLYFFRERSIRFIPALSVEEVNMGPGFRWHGEDSAMSIKFCVPLT